VKPQILAEAKCGCKAKGDNLECFMVFCKKHDGADLLLAALKAAPLELPLASTVKQYELWMNDYVSWRLNVRAAALAKVRP